MTNPYAANAFAGAFVLCAMFVLFHTFTGPSSGDWVGYAQLYGDQGGWLLDQKRDPAFIFVLSGAHSIFGPHGYNNFRVVLSGVFSGFAAWLALSMPAQYRMGHLSIVVTTLIVICAFSLKSFVQIREGLAFLFIIVPIVSMFRDGRSGILLSGLGTLAALAFHSGTIVLAVLWLISASLMFFPDRLLASRVFHRVMLTAGLLAGAGLGALTIFYANDVRFFLGSYGVNVHARTVSGLSKDLYWLLSGIIALKIREDLLKAVVGVGHFAFGYASILGSIAVPTIYGICLTLVLFSFGTPALTSMMIRLFFTVTELALIIIALRGRANIATTLIAVFMLVDRIRVVGESS